MTGSWKPNRTRRLAELGFNLSLLAFCIFVERSLWVSIFVLCLTQFVVLTTVMALRGRVTIGDGWIEVADHRRAQRFHVGHAVWQVRRRTKAGQPTVIHFIDEDGRTRIFGPKLYPQEAGHAVFAVLRWFPEVSREVKRALPSHQHPPLAQGVDEPR